MALYFLDWQERVAFAKHKGCYLEEVPSSYLQWVLSECDITDACRETIQMELTSRQGASRTKEQYHKLFEGVGIKKLEEKVLQAYREMALKYHPDRGSSHDAMKVINEFMERLQNGLQK